MMSIKLLTQNLINQIAAGEVIERPSSVIKELMENSIDAGATRIDVHIINAGKSFISVADNGVGMDRDSLELCILSHATSKLSSENLFDIRTFGFRGEALPSIASVSRLSITSAKKSLTESSNDDSIVCWNLSLEGQNNMSMIPANRSQGTTIEVRDLFFATPARLKFLKSDSSETESCRDVFNRMALAFRGISFRFFETNKEKFNYHGTESLQKRIEDVFGASFCGNMFAIDVQNGNLKLSGYIGLPTFNKASAGHQYFFVNNRFVKDKIFATAMRSAYAGLVPQGRHPVAVLYLDIPYNEVDVNAHPAKTEIRFRDAETVRYFLASEVKKALSMFGSNRSTTEAIDNFYEKTRKNVVSSLQSNASSGKFQQKALMPDLSSRFTNFINQEMTNNEIPIGSAKQQFAKNASSEKYTTESLKPEVFSAMAEKNPSEDHRVPAAATDEIDGGKYPHFFNELVMDADDFTDNAATKRIDGDSLCLGSALCQINNTYVVASNGENLIVVDQHAAAERITLEKLKNNNSLDSQVLLIPEVCALNSFQVELLEKNADFLSRFGIFFEKLSHDMVVVNALPALLETCDAKSIMEDIIDELCSFGDTYTIEEKINRTLSIVSCHGSLRAGKKMSIEEMNSLLRQMENTENIAQCCHGRPSYVIISNKILNKFFDRC